MAKATMQLTEADVTRVHEIVGWASKHPMTHREFRSMLSLSWVSKVGGIQEHIVEFSNGIRVVFVWEFQSVDEAPLVHRHIVISSVEELTPVAVNMVLALFRFEGSLGAIPPVMFKAWVEFIKKGKPTLHIIEPVRGWDGCPKDDKDEVNCPKCGNDMLDDDEGPFCDNADCPPEGPKAS